MTRYIGTEFSDMLGDAAYRCECTVNELEMYSWPEGFSDTTGPRGGIGGQMFTVFQVYAFRVSGNKEGFKYCAGRRKKWNGEIEESWDSK